MSESGELAILILAAGQGTRMKSRRPKVLHSICGRPMLHYPLAAAEALSPSRLRVVVGHGADAVREAFAGRAEFVLQEGQRGTGHAVLTCRESLEGFDGDVVIMYGDTPLLRGETLIAMSRHKRESGADLVMLSALLPLPGRVVRDAAGQVELGEQLDDAARFEQLERFAVAISATTGATRVVTDRSWVPHERQIGTTGVVVAGSLITADYSTTRGPLAPGGQTVLRDVAADQVLRVTESHSSTRESDEAP